MSKRFFQAPIRGYQYISRMLPASCRYYPTCSEYAKWQFEFNSPYKALFLSTARIMRCNQLFEGGIDYPKVRFYPESKPIPCCPNGKYDKIKIIYWLVPKSNNYYYILKDFDENHTKLPS